MAVIVDFSPLVTGEWICLARFARVCVCYLMVIPKCTVGPGSREPNRPPKLLVRIRVTGCALITDIGIVSVVKRRARRAGRISKEEEVYESP